MGRRRVKDLKTKAICLRLTEKQFEILAVYTNVKGFMTEVEALRHIVDGLEAWIAKQDADMDDEPTIDLLVAPPAPAMDHDRTQT